MEHTDTYMSKRTTMNMPKGQLVRILWRFNC